MNSSQLTADVVWSTEPKWQRVVNVARHTLARHPENAMLGIQALAAALGALGRLAPLIDSAIEELPIAPDSTYQPPPIKLVPRVTGDLQTVAREIDEYLTSYGVRDVALTLGPLRHAMQRNQPLPLVPVLQAMGAWVFGSLTPQKLVLQQWLESEDAAEAVTNVLDTVSAEFEAVVNGAIGEIARAGAAADLITAKNIPLPPSPPKEVKKGTKRKVDDAAELKAAKNARLLRALAAASATLNQ